MSRRENQVLVLDADDTLWENNVYFEQVIDDFVGWLAHPTLEPVAVRALLDDVERANAATHGYGSAAFLHNLGACLERAYERDATEPERARIADLVAHLTAHPVELIAGVPETLAELGRRHPLHLLTKGADDEQRRKLDGSGLAAAFRTVDVVPEKDAAVYRRLAAEHGWPAERTWMIGNSPRSDIRPARAAGLNAVFVPHEHTWVLEHDELEPGDDRVLTVTAFPDLLDHF